MKRVIPFAYLDEPSIKTLKPKKAVKNVEESSEDCQKEIMDYLKRSELLNDRTKAKKVKGRATRYVMISGELYQRSFFGPYYKCLNKGDCRAILGEVHEGECGNHAMG